MDKIQKHINLSREAEQVLNDLKAERGFRSMNQTLEYMIMDYNKNRDIAAAVSRQVTEDLSKVLTRIRLGTNVADRNSQIILEVLNSIAYQFDVAPMTTDFEETSAVSVAKESVKNRIAELKQRKDNKAGKKG